MNINLRKANAIQLAINSALSSTSVPLMVNIERYDVPAEVIAAAELEFLNGLEKKQALLGTLYSIRNKVSDAAHEAGVSSILCQMAMVDKLIAILSPVAETRKTRPSMEKVDSMFADLKTEKSDGYSRRDSINVSVPTADHVKANVDLAASQRKLKQICSDTLLDLNVKTEITLSDAEVDILQKYQLI